MIDVPRKNNILYNLDWFSVFIYLLFVFFGWINIYASGYTEEHKDLFDFSYRHGKQLIWISAALIIALVSLLIDAKFYAAFASYFYILILFVLLLVLFFGVEINGAKAWFQLGAIRIQPAEFAKLATSLALAKLLSSYSFSMKKINSLLAAGAVILLPMLFIFLQNDTGSAVVFSVFILVLYREGLSGFFLVIAFYMVLLFIFSLLMSSFWISLIVIVLTSLILHLVLRRKRETLLFLLFISVSFGLFFAANQVLPLKLNIYEMVLFAVLLSLPYLVIRYLRYKIYTGLLVLSFLVGSLVVNYSVDYVFDNVLEEYQRNRINNLLGIESDPLGWGYNVNQSKIAIGSGGFTGKGFLNGTQTKFKFVPEQSTDFIFCTIGEEWGFVGASLLIVLYLIFLLRLIYIAERQRSTFSRVFIYSVASIFFFHFAINIGMTIGLVPVIGIPLPFFSYGGSSLWGFTLLLFIALKFDTARKEVIL